MTTYYGDEGPPPKGMKWCHRCSEFVNFFWIHCAHCGICRPNEEFKNKSLSATRGGRVYWCKWCQQEQADIESETRNSGRMGEKGGRV